MCIFSLGMSNASSYWVDVGLMWLCPAFDFFNNSNTKAIRHCYIGLMGWMYRIILFNRLHVVFICFIVYFVFIA